MSFTLTNQSVMRFESSSSRLGDEWQRTLMFFNVDISGGVHCDHRNEITASRPQDRNGTRRNPGGGLSNPIRECSMPFGKPNEFYAQSRDDCDHRGFRSRQRSHPDRRKSSSYCENCRHLHYRSAIPRWNNSDIAPFSHFPTQNSTHRCAHKSYPNDKYELPNQHSRDLTSSEEARDSRDCYNTESYTDSSYESPHDYTNERQNLGSYQRSYEPPPYRVFKPYYTERQSCNESLSQLNIFRPKGNPRQASGSILPDYALNYKDKYHKIYKNEGHYVPIKDSSDSSYEGSQPPHELGNKVRYSPKKRFGFEDYGGKRLRPPPLLFPKPKAKFRSDCRPSYKTYKEKGFSRNYKTEADRFKNRSGESGSGHRNRCRRHPNITRVLPYLNHFKKSPHNNKISTQNLNFVPTTMHENNPMANGSVPRRAPEKRKLNIFLEEIPQPFKKWIKKEVPCSNFRSFLSINDEIPRRNRNSRRESSVNFGNRSSSKLDDHHDRKSNRKPSTGKKKLFKFGSEIPYRLCKSVVPSMLFKYDIPLKWMKGARTSYLKDSNSDWSCDSALPHSKSAAKLKKEPQVSLYEVENNHPQKSMKQKLSGFLKMSKKSPKGTNTLKDQIIKMKAQRRDGQDNEKPSSRTNTQKSRESEPSTRNKTTSAYEQKECCSTNPSLTIKAKRCLSKLGTGSHYPTVFRGKGRSDETEVYSLYNFMNSMRISKCDHHGQKLYNRISSGNNSINSDGKKNVSICESEKNLSSQKSVSWSGLKNIASRVSTSHGSSNSWREREPVSSKISILLNDKIKENEFRNVRLSPLPSICQCSSTTSSSSENSTIREVVLHCKPSQANLKSIKLCICPPKIIKSASSEVGSDCPRKNICSNWSLTQKSSHPAHDCICTRPPHPGIRVPQNIETISRPPIASQFPLNMRSSLKKSSKPIVKTSNKKVCLNINSSTSCLSKISSAKCSSCDSRCQSEKSIMINDKSTSCSRESIIISDKRPCCSIKIHKMGDEQQIESQSMQSCSSKKSTNISKINLCCNEKKETGNMGKPECDKCQIACSDERKIKIKPGSYTKNITITKISSAKCSSCDSRCQSEKSLMINDKSTSCSRESIIISDKRPCCSINIDKMGDEQQIESQSMQSCSSKKSTNIGAISDERKIKIKPGSFTKNITITVRSVCNCAKNSNIGEMGPCCNAKTEIDNIEKAQCKKFPSITSKLGEERQIESQSISFSCGKCSCSSTKSLKIAERGPCFNSKLEINKTEITTECRKCPIPKACSWSGEQPCTYFRRPTVSYYIPKDPHHSPDSTTSESSQNLSGTNSLCSRDSMQILCMQNSASPCCSMNLNNGSTQSLSHPPCGESSVPTPGRTMVKSRGGKGIVETLKRELMKPFRKKRCPGSPCSGLRHSPHIMFFPIRPHSFIGVNRFYSPDSVVYWAAFPKPPAPF